MNGQTPVTEVPDNRTGFTIVDWDETFEVDDKGGPWKPSRPFRRGPLTYLRMPTVGTAARKWAMIERVAVGDGLQVKGIFDELLRLVAGMNRSEREGGILRGVNGVPATNEDISEVLGQPVETVNRAFEVLLDRRVDLLRKVAPNEQPKPSEPQQANIVQGKAPEIPGSPRPLSDDSGIESGAGSGAKARQEQEQKQGQEQGQRPGDQDGSARTALLSFDPLLTALRSAYGNNPTIRNFASWLWQRYQKASALKWREVTTLIEKLIEKSKAADGEPAAFFIGAVKKSPEDGGFGYRPAKRRPQGS